LASTPFVRIAERNGVPLLVDDPLLELLVLLLELLPLDCALLLRLPLLPLLLPLLVLPLLLLPPLLPLPLLLLLLSLELLLLLELLLALLLLWRPRSGEAGEELL
jgi:hypothetical protein